uniref:Uncharacterized protein n=1 Tax=Sphaerodactylus townsendi TaxID=933632 RepID=A0ACB8EBN1_9SAUR
MSDLGALPRETSSGDPSGRPPGDIPRLPRSRPISNRWALPRETSGGGGGGFLCCAGSGLPVRSDGGGRGVAPRRPPERGGDGGAFEQPGAHDSVCGLGNGWLRPDLRPSALEERWL